MSAGYRVFLSEFWNNFQTTGSIAPSSRWLASALARWVPSPAETASRRILEVGPGTGAATAAIVRQLSPRDTLTLVELNGRFVEHLRRRFQHEPEFLAVSERVEIVHDRLESLPGDRPFDVIVSGLPLNNFPAAAVEQILSIYDRLLVGGGRLSFFEYIAVRTVRGAISLGAERERLGGITRALQAMFARYEHRQQAILANLPPAWVHHLQKPQEIAARVPLSGKSPQASS